MHIGEGIFMHGKRVSVPLSAALLGALTFGMSSVSEASAIQDSTNVIPFSASQDAATNTASPVIQPPDERRYRDRLSSRERERLRERLREERGRDRFRDERGGGM
jgi:hypothetical protein